MTANKIRGGLWFSLHRWCSLPVWMLLFFICVTGTLSVVSHEITWLIDPKTRAFNPDSAALLGYGEITAAVEREWSAAEPLFIVDRAPYIAVQVITALPDAPAATVYVNQYTGEVQGITRGATFSDFMRSLHGWLLMPWDSGTSWGYYLVGAMGLLLLGSLVTALVVDKYFWRAFYRPRVRTTKGARIFWSDLHRVIGVWSIPFIAIIAVTGLWYLIQGAVWDAQMAIQPPAPMIEREALPEVAAGAPAELDLDRAVAAARAAIPDFDVKWISLPETGYHHTEVYGTSGFPLLSDFAVAAYVDPYTGEVAHTRRMQDFTAIQWLDHLADPLHYGHFAGIWSKAIWTAFGLALSAMVFTGMLVWLRRTARVKKRHRRRVAIPSVAVGSDQTAI